MADQFFPIQNVDPQKIAQNAVPTAGQQPQTGTSQGINLPNLFMANTGALRGVLTDPQLQTLQNEATKRAALMTGLGLFAMPRNRGYGSALPYLAQSYLQFGVPAAQGVVGTAQQAFKTQLDLAKAVQDAQTKQYELVPADYREYMLAVQDAERKGKPITDDFTEWTRKNKQAGAIRFNTEATYAGELAKQLVAEDVKLVQNAEKLPMNIEDNDRIITLIKDGNPMTGRLSQIENALAGVEIDFFNKNGKMKEDKTTTELLDAALGSQVFPLIGDLGIGARGLDTPAEREFLQKVMTGDITLTDETLTKMAIMRNNKIGKAANRYNEKLARGDLDGYQKQKKLFPVNVREAYVINELRDPDTGKVFSVMSDGRALFNDEEGNLTNQENKDYNYLVDPIFPPSGATDGR